MKSSRLLKISILATALATLTGCPALPKFTDLISMEQEKPKKTLIITGLGEYEGQLIQVMALDSLDTLGERLCLSGGNVHDRVVKDSVGKAIILEMNAQKANTNISGLATIAKNMMGIAKPCDDKERFVMLSVSSPDSLEGENQDANALMEKVLNNTFIYTNGIDICNASADALSNTKITYRFSDKEESRLKFDDFMRASDCEALTEIFKSMSKNVDETDCPHGIWTDDTEGDIKKCPDRGKVNRHKMCGEASFYADNLHGEQTASGEKYDKNELTAAHKTLDYGTKVKVTRYDEANNKFVIVKINDCGPHIKGRIIDLSKKAAEELDMVAEGHIKVKLEIVK